MIDLFDSVARPTRVGAHVARERPQLAVDAVRLLLGRRVRGLVICGSNGSTRQILKYACDAMGLTGTRPPSLSHQHFKTARTRMAGHASATRTAASKMRMLFMAVVFG